MAIPIGISNSPSPCPRFPHWVRKRGGGGSFCARQSWGSASTASARPLRRKKPRLLKVRGSNREEQGDRHQLLQSDVQSAPPADVIEKYVGTYTSRQGGMWSDVAPWREAGGKKCLWK